MPPELPSNHPTHPLIPPPLEAAFRVCRECGRNVREDESIVLSGVVVCAACKPVAVAKLQMGGQLGDGGAWRDKRTLVMGPRAILPDRCVKCNAPTHGEKLKRQLYWHSPWIYLTILLNLLIYLIIALVVRKQAKIEVGLCAQHRTKRWMHIAIAWGLMLGGGAGITVGVNNLNPGPFVGFGILAIVVGIFWGVFGSRVVYARSIDTQWIRLGGAGQPFLESLPEFPKLA